jgi:glyoxylase-like metal-dependent hydrolase (beta-lactamase superfamily II)
MRQIIPLLSFLLILQSGVAQKNDVSWSERLRGHQKAVEIVNRSMEALGGVANTKAIKSLQIEWEGNKYMDGQSINFNKPLVPLPLVNTVIIDFEKDRIVNENVDRYLGGYIFHFRNVYADSAFSYEVPKYRFSGIADINPTTKATLKQVLLRSLPNYLVMTATEKKQTLRYSGRIKDANNELEVVSFSYNPNLSVDIYFDSRSFLPVRYTYFTDHAIHGDQMISYDFASYKNVNGVMFPQQRMLRANDQLMREEKMKSIALNSLPDPNVFVKPAGLNKQIVLEKKLKEIGRNIFMLEGLNGYNPLILNFKDHIMIVEAVAGSEEAIQTAKNNFPGKPIKYVALSHYHEDHTGGLSAFVKNNITVVANKTDEKYIRHVASAQHSVIPSAPYSGTVTTELVDSSKTFKDENLALEIINVGKTDHSDNMLVFYFPEEKILYQADMLISTDEGKISYPLIPLNLQFYEFLKRKSLDIKMIYGVHWKNISFSDFEQAVSSQSKAGLTTKEK